MKEEKGKPLSILDGIPFASKENIEVKNKVAAAECYLEKIQFLVLIQK